MVKSSDAHISNTGVVKDLCLVYLFVTLPKLSTMTFLTFCPVFSDNYS